MERVAEVVMERADEPEVVGAPRPRRAARLLVAEKRLVAFAALGPIVIAALVLAPIASAIGASIPDLMMAALVYGGLLGLAAAFVTYDRVQARQCPRCAGRHPGARRCPDCGYDLIGRPRFACERRHVLGLEPGLCPCGRRLQPLPNVRGIAREVVFMLKLGAWLLALLIGIGIALRLMDGAG